MSKNILVTGGAGYIGSHTCKLLKSYGFTPIVYDNFENGHREFVKWGPAIEGDIQDVDLLKKTLNDHKIDAVMHFAAYAYVGESVKKPELYFRNNLTGSLSLLRAMLECQVTDIVFSSSCATYGNPETLPITENSLQKPINPYGLSKLMVEQVLEEFAKAYGFKTIALRYFNAAGASFDGDIGEDHSPETHLIPLALKAADQGTEFSVFGNDYPTQDGTCVRDYIHVNDLADAHIRALQFIQKQKSGQSWAFNLGNDSGHSILEVIRSVEKVTGKTLRIKTDARRAGDPPSLVASSKLARSTLQWQPATPNIDDIVSSAWKWHSLSKK